MFAQFSDDFSDGDFTGSPSWAGSTSEFAVVGGSLRLQADPSLSSAYLIVPSIALSPASWEFVVGLEFNSSSTNHARVYLASDSPDLHNPLNGYFVQIGSSTDDVRLIRQTGEIRTTLIDGPDGVLDVPVSTTHIKVTVDSAGHWELLFDTGSGTYESAGVATDRPQMTGRFFGVLCMYTATRADRFFFDDFKVDGEGRPLSLDALSVVSGHTLALTFSRPLDPVDALNAAHYEVSDGLGTPVSVILDSDGVSVTMEFSQRFSSRIVYTLNLRDIHDSVGGVLAESTHEFVFAEPAQAREVIFTEIMADPSPRNLLPESEYVELFNRADRVVDLSEWRITDGSTTAILPSFFLPPGEYVVISADNFSVFGNAIQHEIPSLNNDGDEITLLRSDGLVVDSVVYTADWYRDRGRMNGGWSLELIDPNRTCSDHRNWVVSNSPAGGTPGQVNSVAAENPDLLGPVLLSAIPIADTAIRILFNESMHKTLPPVTSVSLEPFVALREIQFGDDSRTSYRVFGDSLSRNTSYTISIGSVYDCAGNEIAPSSVTFGLPEPAGPGDLVLNEVLFNPWPNGADFIELYNASTHFINLNEVTVSSAPDTTLSTNRHTVATQDLLIAPDGYLAITEDPWAVLNDYPRAHETNLLAVDKLPPMNDDEGTIAIFFREALIDRFSYAASFHSPFLKDDEGVSLERLSAIQPTNDPQNWKSASGDAGYATPGYQNSNASLPSVPGQGIISVTPKVFDPLNGTPSFSLLHYTLDHPGYIGTVRIYDDRGRVIRNLADNVLLGTSGNFRWDGDREDGSKARVGYYLVSFEVFDQFGTIRRYREPVAIATTF